MSNYGRHTDSFIVPLSAGADAVSKRNNKIVYNIIDYSIRLCHPYKPFLLLLLFILTNSEGIPHMTTNDDEYIGYYIPKGTHVIGNGWSVRTLLVTLILCFDFLIYRSILHYPKIYTTPEEFQPERYLKDGALNPDTRDPDCAAFGYGRRSVDAMYPLTYTVS